MCFGTRLCCCDWWCHSFSYTSYPLEVLLMCIKKPNTHPCKSLHGQQIKVVLFKSICFNWVPHQVEGDNIPPQYDVSEICSQLCIMRDSLTTPQTQTLTTNFKLWPGWLRREASQYLHPRHVHHRATVDGSCRWPSNCITHPCSVTVWTSVDWGGSAEVWLRSRIGLLHGQLHFPDLSPGAIYLFGFWTYNYIYFAPLPAVCPLLHKQPVPQREYFCAVVSDVCFVATLCVFVRLLQG